MSIKKINEMNENIINNHLDYSDIEMYQKLNDFERMCHIKASAQKSFTQMAYEKGYHSDKYEPSDLEDVAKDYADEMVNSYFEDADRLMKTLINLWRNENSFDDFTIPNVEMINKWLLLKFK